MAGKDPHFGLRLWRTPLPAHAVGLLVVLLALVPVVGTDMSYSADEGAAIIQARSLEEGDGWIVPHPLPEVDPEGSLYPLELSSVGPDGVAPYAKHPLYPVLLAGADRLAGHLGMVLLSVLGTLLAATGASVLAGQVGAGLERLTLWAVGLGSPLLFSSYWVIAHSLGAAAVVWAVVAATHEGDRALPRWLARVGAAPLLLVAATMLRTEAGLFAVAMAAAGVLVGLLRRDASLALSGVGAALAVVVARRTDDRWLEQIVGGSPLPTPRFDPRPVVDRVGGQVDGFVQTWLRPAPIGETSVSGLLALLAAAFFAAAAVHLLLERPRQGGMLAALGAAALLLRLALPAEPVPGLLMAWPILAVGAVAAARRPAWARWPAAYTAVALFLGWGAVLATQYPEGGTAEWGGRYFAIGVPLAAPLLVGAIRDLLRSVEPHSARRVGWALVVGTLALSAGSVLELRRVHRGTAEVFDDIDELATAVDGEVVIVSDSPPHPRLDWAQFEDRAWLLVHPETAPDLPDRLRDEGHDQWLIVARDPDSYLAEWPGLRIIDQRSDNILLVESSS